MRFLLVLVLGVAATDWRPQAVAGKLPCEPAIQHALSAGEYAGAERLAESCVVDAAAASGPNSLEVATVSDLLVESQLKQGKAGRDDTVGLAQRTALMKERLVGPGQPELAVSLHNLGDVRAERGELREAVRLHRRGLEIRRRALPATDPAIADSLEHLSIPLITLERFPEAQRSIQEAKRIRAREPIPRSQAHALYLEALLHRWDGDYAAARTALARALEIYGKESSDYPDVVAMRRLDGDLYFLSGDIAGAQTAWQEALGIVERTRGNQHPVVPVILRVLALAAKESGNLQEARSYLHRAFLLADASVPCLPDYAELLNDLALLSEYDGDYREARKTYARALSRSTQCYGLTHSMTATLLFNMGTLLNRTGDLAEAERLERRALQAWSARLGPNHPYVARAFETLAATLLAERRMNLARGYVEQALSIRKRALGPDHPDVASTLVTLAQIAQQSGNLRLASTRLDEAFAIYARGGHPQDPDYFAAAVLLRAALAAARGDYPAARSDYQDALARREAIFGAGHPSTADAQVELAAADLALGFGRAALMASLDAEKAHREHLRSTVRYIPEREALLVTSARKRGLDLALSIIAGSPQDDPSLVLDALVQSRGLVIDELADRARGVAHDSARSASLSVAVSAERERFANLMLGSMQGEAISRARLDEARRRKEDVERALAEQSAEARDELARRNVDLEEVRRALPPRAALISYVKYDRTTFATTGARTRVIVRPSYLAFVMSSSTRPTVVTLGDAAQIEALIERWRSEIEGHAVESDAARLDERAYRAAALTLRQRIWDPVAEPLSAASRVFIVPDGALNLVSFDALPVGSRYLADEGPTIHLLSTERDLLSTGAATSSRGLLVVGGPTYDIGSAGARASAQQSGCAERTPLHFENLPGSLTEAREIARLWTGAAGDQSPPSELLMLTGTAATKRAVANALPGRRVVHLATHGFFLRDSCTTPSGTRAVGGLVEPGVRTQITSDSPLLLAGLAFAGANHRQGLRADTGILTAEEFASLNLQGTEWAVLSACDTGLGDIRPGEGVFGLRRAFQIAGARTVIMSLWSVGDEPTRRWMRALYENRLVKHLDTADSVRQASLTVLKERRASGKSTHPFYWAAFVAAGDWR